MIKKEDLFSKEIVGAAIEVHRNLGPGLLESAYEECLCREFAIRRFAFERQKPLPENFALFASLR
jgi:GxxExxY protein